MSFQQLCGKGLHRQDQTRVMLLVISQQEWSHRYSVWQDIAVLSRHFRPATHLRYLELRSGSRRKEKE